MASSARLSASFSWPALTERPPLYLKKIEMCTRTERHYFMSLHRKRVESPGGQWRFKSCCLLVCGTRRLPLTWRLWGIASRRVQGKEACWFFLTWFCRRIAGHIHTLDLFVVTASVLDCFHLSLMQQIVHLMPSCTFLITNYLLRSVVFFIFHGYMS